MKVFNHYLILIKFALRGEEGFYAARKYLAEVLIGELEEFIDIKGKKVLDVGGERGEFCKILAKERNCRAINLEPKSLEGGFVHKTVIASADRLPFKNGEFDIVLLRGVLQHIPADKKLKSLQEIRRVLKKDGILYLMIPPWYNPLSGQNIKPFQYFPFPIAKHLSEQIMRRKINGENLADLGLWPMTFRSTLGYLGKAQFRIIKTTDILGRLHIFTKIPGIREILLPSVGFILRKM